MWKVLFYQDAPGLLAPYHIGIFATNVGWNDFGFNFNAQLRLTIGGITRDFSVKLLPFKEDTAQDAVSTWIHYLSKATAGEVPWRPANTIYPNYVTVFSSVSSYKELAKDLQANEYDELLKSIWELNACTDANLISKKVFKQIVESPQFATGVLRNAGPYKAFRFGYFSANRMPPPDDARIAFNFSTQLEGFANEHVVNFTYKNLEVMSDRIHCLIGVNGIGKTSLLNDLIIATLKKINSVSANGCSSEIYGNEGQLIDTNRPIASQSWVSLPIFSRINMYSTDPHNFLPRTTNLKGSFDYQYFDMGLEGTGSLAMQLGDLLRSEDNIGSEDRFVLLKKIIQQVIPSGQLMIPVLPALQNSAKMLDIRGDSWIPIGAIRGGELRKLEIIGNIDSERDLAFQIGSAVTTPLSSGQKMYFRFATHFLTSASKGMLVLIDEPETHLHPNLITEFMNLLYLVLEATSSVAIIATHSVYVVRETPSHCVHVFQSDAEKNIRIENVYLNTLGANVSSLSNAVFGDSLVQSFTDKIASHIAKKQFSLDEIIDRYKPILSMDMLAKIRELMKVYGDPR